jgi:hypothetical protein
VVERGAFLGRFHCKSSVRFDSTAYLLQSTLSAGSKLQARGNHGFPKTGLFYVKGTHITPTLTDLMTEFCNIFISVCVKMQYFESRKNCFLEFVPFNFTN